MADDKKISQLTTAEQLTENDLFPLVIPNAQSSTGFVTRKTSGSSLGVFFNNVLQFATQLTTTAKTVCGAINEVKTTADGASSSVGTLATTVEGLQSYADGDTVDLTGFTQTSILSSGTITLFIPLRKEISTGLSVSISGNWNTYGDLTNSNVTLASLGTVTIAKEELGLVVTIATSGSSSGTVLFESIDATITFEEES